MMQKIDEEVITTSPSLTVPVIGPFLLSFLYRFLKIILGTLMSEYFKDEVIRGTFLGGENGPYFGFGQLSPKLCGTWPIS